MREVFCFKVNGVDYKFGLVEFAMVMGLKFSKKIDTSDYITTGETQLRERYFSGTKHVSYGDLCKVFKNNILGNNDEHAVKIDVLYFLHYGLMRSDNKKIMSKSILGLINDWDVFNKHP